MSEAFWGKGHTRVSGDKSTQICVILPDSASICQFYYRILLVVDDVACLFLFATLNLKQPQICNDVLLVQAYTNCSFPLSLRPINFNRSQDVMESVLHTNSQANPFRFLTIN